MFGLFKIIKMEESETVGMLGQRPKSCCLLDKLRHVCFDMNSGGEDYRKL